MSLLVVGAVALAFGLDVIFGEPPARIHPVAWFGRLVDTFDREWQSPHLVGTAVAVVLPIAAAVGIGGLVSLAGRVDPLVAGGVVGLALFTATSLRMLLGEARAVIELTEGDLDAARDRLRSLAGRDASDLSPGEVRSAAVESVAENLADGLVAPLVAFALGAVVSLPVAAGAAVWVKAVNTLDSMLGYHSKPVGTASARLDDAVMWLPARLSAVLVSTAALDPASLGRARAHASKPTSPNSGWPMATLAAVLRVHLAKRGAYDLPLGPEFPTTSEGLHGIRIVRRAGVLSYALAATAGSAAGYLAPTVGVIAWS